MRDNISYKIAVHPLIRRKFGNNLTISIPPHQNRINILYKLGIGIDILIIAALPLQPIDSAITVRNISVKAHSNK